MVYNGNHLLKWMIWGGKPSILIGFSITFTIHFGVFPIFLETPTWWLNTDLLVFKKTIGATFLREKTSIDVKPIWGFPKMVVPNNQWFYY